MLMTEATVQRRLRLALEAISHFVERGRGLGQRIIVALMVWLAGRTASDVIHSAAQGAVIATAAAVIATHPGTIGAVDHPHSQAAPAARVVAPVPSPTAPVSATVQAPYAQAPSVQLPSVQVPSVQVPQLPKLPVKIKQIL
jgi:hypothetical protein